VDAHEIDVRRKVLDDVALNATANDVRIRLTFNLEVEQRLQEASCLQALEKVVIVQVDGCGSLPSP
jgi:hypothetical protein